VFSGLVESKAKLIGREPVARGQRLRFSHSFKERLVIGESIAVNGACLTVTDFDSESFSAEVSPETLTRTTLGDLPIQASVNLERSLKLGDRMGGHIVLGHIDGLGSVKKLDKVGDFYRILIELPGDLVRYAVDKGSIAIDGVSLTINKVLGNQLELMIIPHTWNITTMGELNLLQRLNIECDYLAKLVDKQRSKESSAQL
jgi:riboflavin synthase